MQQFLAAAALSVLAGAASAQGAWTAFDSITSKSRFELANASYDHRPVAIRGMLGLPSGGKGPYPAMVLAHGSGGIEQKEWDRWVPLLNKMGVATFVVDSFTTRGIARTVDDQSQLDQSGNDADALSPWRCWPGISASIRRASASWGFRAAAAWRWKRRSTASGAASSRTT